MRLEMKIDATQEKRALVSALVDGQLYGDAFARTVEWLGEADEGWQTWDAYHVLGEVMRSGDAGVQVSDADFMQRLRYNLQQESKPLEALQARPVNAPQVVLLGVEGLELEEDPAANDSRFRWKMVAGFASLAMVSVLGWQAMGSWNNPATAPQLAQLAPLIELANGEAQVMLRDPQLDALLAAHRQFGGTSALQMPAGFLRNATFDEATR
jgi:sigma-E factor negative regulatory protein RseA